MAKVVAVNLETGLVRRALSAGARKVQCSPAADSATILRTLDQTVPDLIVLGGDASLAGDTAEVLFDEPRLISTPMVAWRVRGTAAETSRLVALGVQLVDESEEALAEACEEVLEAIIPTLKQPSPDDPVELRGRRVLVADDDPAITWYFADLLRAHKCEVEEVIDGEVALDRARRTVPDLIISDIRMPRMDGPRLCTALRADPILGDIPVVLLSWKDDWLKRAEDGGVEAAAYLEKRATPEEVRLCVQRVLSPHDLLEHRINMPGPVRGRLENTTTYRLLRLVCAARPEARLTLQSPPHIYEIHIRESAPRSILRTDHEGTIVRGTPALEGLMTERSGRFSLDVERTPVEADVTGTLHQQIAGCVARARDHVIRPPPARSFPQRSPQALDLQT